MHRSQRTTALGALEGRTVPVVTANGPRPVETFLGVPYGRAERFRPAHPAPGWTGVLDATHPGPAAPQPRGGPELVPGFQPVGELSEDCLSLSVWTPVPAGGDARPVMVWIHGGSFITGASSLPISDGSRLAAEDDVVVVAINYRVGALGFVSLTATGGADWGAAANLGLRDQLLALAWVREHIAAFGGDPGRVTVFGESAGGGSIQHLLTSPHLDGGFDRAIVQSGSTGRTLDADAAALIGDAFLRAIGLGRADEAALCAFSADEIVAAQLSAMADPAVWAAAGMMPYHPCIDGEVVAEVPLAAMHNGAGREIDLVLGTTRDEMQLFLEAPTMERPRVVKRVSRYAGVDEDRAEALVHGYEDLLARAGRRAEPVDAWGAIFSDREMLFPARDALDAHAAAGGTTYGYLFAWDAPTRPDGRPLGAAHAIDLPFTFGNFDQDWTAFVGADADPEGAAACSRAMRAAWCSFAAGGDPATDVAGPWARWSVGERATMVFGASSHASADPSAARVALWEGIA